MFPLRTPIFWYLLCILTIHHSPLSASFNGSCSDPQLLAHCAEIVYDRSDSEQFSQFKDKMRKEGFEILLPPSSLSRFNGPNATINPLTYDPESVFVLKNEETKDTIIAFRGTDNYLDAALDCCVKELDQQDSDNPQDLSSVHSGAHLRWQALSKWVYETLAKVSPSSLHITGHSLGGGVSHLAAQDLNSAYNIRSVVTFGTMGGYAETSILQYNQTPTKSGEKLGALTTNYIFTDDPVPHLGTFSLYNYFKNWISTQVSWKVVTLDIPGIYRLLTPPASNEEPNTHAIARYKAALAEENDQPLQTLSFAWRTFCNSLLPPAFSWLTALNVKIGEILSSDTLKALQSFCSLLLRQEQVSEPAQS